MIHNKKNVKEKKTREEIKQIEKDCYNLASKKQGNCGLCKNCNIHKRFIEKVGLPMEDFY